MIPGPVSLYSDFVAITCVKTELLRVKLFVFSIVSISVRSIDMDRTRKNTVKIAFGLSAKPPAYLEVFEFVGNVLKVQSSIVHSLYKDENERCFYLKFIDEVEFKHFTNKMNVEYPFFYEDGSRILVKLNVASSISRYVRIYNLPPEIDDHEIAAVLKNFGVIKQHVREKFAESSVFPVFSGIRGVYLEVAKELPANIFIANFKVRLFYEGMKSICFYCKNQGHIKKECPKLACIKEMEIATIHQTSLETRTTFSQVLKSAATRVTPSCKRSALETTATCSTRKHAPAVIKPLKSTGTINSGKNKEGLLDDGGDDEDDEDVENEGDDEDEEDVDNEGDDEDEEEDEDDENKKEDDDDSVDNDDDEMDKTNLKRTISSPSSMSETEKRKKSKSKNEEPPIPVVETIGRRTRERTAKMKECK